MLPSPGYQDFSAASLPSGWVLLGDTWVLRWGSQQVASVAPSGDGAAMSLNCRKYYQVKRVRAASIAQGKRYAERWCAARLYPEMRLREAVARLTDSTPRPPPPPMPGLPPTREQLQQARRNAEAGVAELGRIKEALAPRQPPAATKPRPRDARKAWVRAGMEQMRRGV